MDTPAKAFHYLNSQHEDSPVFAFDRAVHAAILEPDIFKQQYVLETSYSKRNNEEKKQA